VYVSFDARAMAIFFDFLESAALWRMKRQCGAADLGQSVDGQEVLEVE
jgi:hypothetical protein